MVHIELPGMDRDKLTPLTLAFLVLTVVELGDMQFLGMGVAVPFEERKPKF